MWTQQLPPGGGPVFDDGCLHAGSLVFNGVNSSDDLSAAMIHQQSRDARSAAKPQPKTMSRGG
jgi:hypothetical protein